MWLLNKGKVKVRVFLLKQQILDDDLCPFGCDTSETTDHFVYGYCHTKLVFHHLGIDLTALDDLTNIYKVARMSLPERRRPAWELMITVIFWAIWLSQNRKVFDDAGIPVSAVAKQCQELAALKSHRAKEDEKMAILQ